MDKSSVGDNINAPNAGWSFGGEVPKSFDSHVSKSVPLYADGHKLVVQLTDYFLPHGGTVYELGTSTGELLKKIGDHNPNPNIKMIGIDREQGMIEQAQKKCANDTRIHFQHAELIDLEMEKCDVVISYYTMQFVRPAFRQELFNRIFESLNWGGAFILFEKVRAPDARFQDITTGLYTDYKLDQGYSSEEIISKARSLKGVLEPFSTQANFEFLQRAGFKDAMTIMKYINFEGILAIK